MIRVLLVDDDKNVLKSLTNVLTRLHFEVTACSDGQRAVDRLSRGRIDPDVVVVDLNMPGVGGLEVLRAIKGHSDVPVVILTGYGTIRSTVDAMKNDAFEYLLKPVNPTQIDEVLRRAAASRDRTADPIGGPRLIGESASMKELLASVCQAAGTPFTVLIHGESGTGKELVARRLHASSGRSHGPFIPVNCASVRAGLAESAFLGHRRGSFTGAVEDHVGFIAAADGGTLFLDEIGDLPIEAQGILLRVLEERSICTLGDTVERDVNIRVVAATHRDLREEVRSGEFREDLFYRLNVVELGVPPLRDRSSDVPALVKHFLEQCRSRVERGPRAVSDSAVRRLVEFDWPGNVRQLRNVVERSFALCPGVSIEPEHLPDEVVGRAAEMRDAGSVLERSERRQIQDALSAASGNKSEAARQLGIDRKQLYRKMKRLQVEL